MADSASRNLRSKSLPAPEVVELQQKLVISGKGNELIMQMAGEEQAAVEFYENLIDTKPNITGNAKKADELEKVSSTELQLERGTAAAAEKEETASAARAAAVALAREKRKYAQIRMGRNIHLLGSFDPHPYLPELLENLVDLEDVLVEAERDLQRLETMDISGPAPSIDVVQRRRHAPSTFVHIKNLVRPFNLPQLRDKISKHGVVKEGRFWSDRVRSQAIFEMATMDQAISVCNSLDGEHWPAGNLKTLSVCFTTKEGLDSALAGKTKPDRESSLGERGECRARGGGEREERARDDFNRNRVRDADREKEREEKRDRDVNEDTYHRKRRATENSHYNKVVKEGRRRRGTD